MTSRRAAGARGGHGAVRASRRELVGAALCASLLAMLVTGSGVVGGTALRPEGWMDADPLYSESLRPPPPHHDFTPVTVDLPRDLFFARQLHAGRVASWNPLSGTGAPLWAEQGGVYFPLKLPFYVAPSLFTYDLFLALRLLVAGLGAYVLARRRGLGHLPALAAGGLFELSGALIEFFAFAVFSPVFLLPWALAGAEALGRGGRGRAVVGSAAVLGVAGLGGHPSFVLLVFAAFAVAALAHLTRRLAAPREAAAVAARVAAAGLLGLALAAPALLPLAELVGEASSYKYRRIGSDVVELALAVSRHTAPIALFAPAVLAELRPSLPVNYSGAAAVGVFGLALGVAGLLRGGLDRALLGVAVLGVALALAPPGLAWVGELPGFRVVLPYYAWALVALPLTQAAGRGVESLRDGRGAWALLAGAAVAAAGTQSLHWVGDPRGRFRAPPFGTLLDAALAGGGGSLRLWLPPLAVAAAATVCVAARPFRWARWMPLAVAGLAVAELLALWPTWMRQPAAARPLLEPSAAVRWLRQGLAGGDARFVASPVSVGFGLSPMLHALPDARGTAALPLRRLHRYASATDPAANLGVHQTIRVLRSPLLDLAAVRYVAVQTQGAPPPFELLDPALSLAFSNETLAIFENRAALPRARIVHEAVAVADQAAARARINEIGGQKSHAAELGWDAWVLLEPDASGRTAPAGAPPPAGARESVRIVDASDPDALVLEAELASPGFVVLADAYASGWRATVDGVETAIHPANLLFRAVPVAAGSHRIEFRYRSRAHAAGWALALGALAACAWLWTRRGRRG